jgi:hypothetical protein
VVLPARPIRPKLLGDRTHVVFRHEDAVARLARAEVLREEALLELGVQDRIAPERARAAHDQVVLADVDGQVLENMGKCRAPAKHRRPALGLPEGLGEESRAVEAQPDRLLPEALEHGVDAGARPLRFLGEQAEPLSALDSVFLG